MEFEGLLGQAFKAHYSGISARRRKRGREEEKEEEEVAEAAAAEDAEAASNCKCVVEDGGRRAELVVGSA